MMVFISLIYPFPCHQLRFRAMCREVTSSLGFKPLTNLLYYKSSVICSKKGITIFPYRLLNITCLMPLVRVISSMFPSRLLYTALQTCHLASILVITSVIYSSWGAKLSSTSLHYLKTCHLASIMVVTWVIYSSWGAKLSPTSLHYI